MTYHLSRRAQVPADNGYLYHHELGLSADVEHARKILINVIKGEIAWLELEHQRHAGQWRQDRIARLNRAIQVVENFTDGVYRCVLVDGTRYGWRREDQRLD